MKERLRIGELAAELGVNPKTIRYYEDIGVLPQPPRTPAGYRMYASADRERLGFILKARAIGLTLEEIADILQLRNQGQQPCGHVLALLERKVGTIDRQLRALRDVRDELLELRRYAVQHMPAVGAICGIIEHREWPGASSPSPAEAPADSGRHPHVRYPTGRQLSEPHTLAVRR
jgi:DNA-binding transcriptional MerR regulator